MPKSEVFNKEKVIKQAMHLFWKHGYHATSMQDLVDTTGLNRSSIYNSFGSKMEVYRLALKQYQKDSDALFQKALVKAGNPREAIQIIFELYLTKTLEDIENKGCFILKSKNEMAEKDEDVKEWLRLTQEHNVHFFEALIIDGQERGLINERQSAEVYAHYLFSALQGLQTTGILKKDKQVLKSIVYNILRLLM